MISSATYEYLANSTMVSQITFRSNSVTAMTTTKQYDYLNRLLRISSVPSADAAVSFDYLYNDANQRTRRTDPDGSYWLYAYDKLGQLTSGKHYWPDGTPVAGQQFEYAYDDIGNRKTTKEGGDSMGAGLRSATYGANSLNQYTNRTVPGAADILGIAHASAGVSVNSDANIYRMGEYFWKELSINNASAAVWQGITNFAWLTGTTNTNTGSIFLPKTPEVFSHDADGNLTNDGRFFYTWDAENRLLKAESLSTSPAASKRKVEWTFDPKGRRVRQVTSDGSSGSYVVSEDLKFLYDGWACQTELNATNNTVIRTYLWGLDLSGSITGAGGVGGLLALSTLNTTPQNHFAAFDGNGNVVALLSPGGAKTAAYDHDPFGRALRTSGTAASENTYRFSTKRANGSTDLALYEYRSHSSLVGRWLNRDPLEESGSLNLCAALSNNPADNVDPDGRRLSVVTESIDKGKCGHYNVNFRLRLSRTPGTTPCEGWIVQKVTIYQNVVQCNLAPFPGNGTQVYWEAWPIGPQEVAAMSRGLVPTYPDMAINEFLVGTPPTKFYRTCGSQSNNGEIKFFCKNTAGVGDLEQRWGRSVPQARNLVSTADPALAAFFSNASDQSQGNASRSVEAVWCCCCEIDSLRYYFLTVSPPKAN